ncbi:hypothetical protein AG1IA_03677 [Rhizoctonia solani AG-1 IA]|uniref:Uncharacterized protein n=1 Tax=Thanatephorus cucumeris (strain AG1-IA) TaxID=983506 RepID=L8WZR1_THACA|nr:hypothetical protein AG1IA_03677 [Rhizoctonia solani AG-1 IA]
MARPVTVTRFHFRVSYQTRHVPEHPGTASLLLGCAYQVSSAFTQSQGGIKTVGEGILQEYRNGETSSLFSYCATAARCAHTEYGIVIARNLQTFYCRRKPRFWYQYAGACMLGTKGSPHYGGWWARVQDKPD